MIQGILGSAWHAYHLIVVWGLPIVNGHLTPHVIRVFGRF